jgi:O-antigen/teichoic acid export membrane protein
VTAVPAPVGSTVADPVAAGGIVGLTRTSLMFGLGAVAGKIVGLVLLPILTRALPATAFGEMDVLLAVANAVTFILLLGLDVAALRLWFDQPDDGARRSLVTSWLAVAVGVALTVAIPVAATAPAISRLLFGRDDLAPAVVAVGVVIVAQSVQVVVLTVLRARGRAAWYAALSGGVLVLYGGGAVALLLTGHTDATAVVGAFAGAMVVSAVAGSVIVRRDLRGRFVPAAVRALLRLGLPLAPAVAAGLAAELLVRTTLLGSAGAEQVAYFTVANRFASVPALVVAAVQLAWLPRTYALGTSPMAVRRIRTEGIAIVGAIAALVLLVGLAGPEAVAVVAGEPYRAALPALGLALVGVLATGAYTIASIASAIERRTSDLGLATGAAAIVSVVVTLLLVGTLRSSGAAAGVAAGQLVAAVVVARLGIRRLDLQFPWARLALGLTAAGLIVVAVLAWSAPVAVRVLVGVVVAGAGAVVARRAALRARIADLG